MKEELTTLMHMEFCKDEDERLDIAAMSIDMEVFRRREIDFETALKKYSITEKQFWEKSTLTKVLDYPNTPMEKFSPNKFMPEELHEKLKECKTKLEILYTYEKYMQDNEKKWQEFYDEFYDQK
jgi:tRNA U34 5-carboxymethylaminomethyl modifying enzyme MnmG/GidA